MTLTREQHSRYHMYRTAYGQTKADAYLAELRRAQAERIATEAMQTFTITDGDVEECSAAFIHEALTAAALAGLEAAR